MEERTVTLSVSACASDCKSCVSSGAGKCDECNEGFLLVSSKCESK